VWTCTSLQHVAQQIATMEPNLELAVKQHALQIGTTFISFRAAEKKKLVTSAALMQYAAEQKWQTSYKHF